MKSKTMNLCRVGALAGLTALFVAPIVRMSVLNVPTFFVKS